MPPICKLPRALVEKIAAGEVIERPASIVKELIENSLDAGAKRIEVRTTDGGRTFISVSDDGSGINSQEAALALQRHTTSKISSDSDLFNIRSFGFRGEALASVAAISHLDLITRTSKEPIGVRVRVEGGELKRNEPYGMPPGTTLMVSQLFFNTPARKKFLRTKSTELGHIDTVLRRASISFLDREFLLENDGEIVLHLPSAESLERRVAQLYGKEIASQLIPFERVERETVVRGLISNPHISFSKSQDIWIYLNGRPIRDRILQAAIMEGYRTALMERRYPLVVALIEVPPQIVDVNVHPTKSEVRFSDPQPIFRLLSEGISNALKRSAPEMVRSLPTQERPYEIAFQATGGLATEIATARMEPLPYLTERMTGPFSSLELLGQLDHTYLLFKGEKQMIIVDQHAAHERVLFEQLKESFESKSPRSQSLLLPITMELPAEKEAGLQKLHELLSHIGFSFEPFGQRTIKIQAVPEVLGAHDPRPLLNDLADDSTEWVNTGAFTDAVEEVISKVACHSAVRAHDTLGPVEIASLLGEMDQIDLATNCPHGRPTFLRLTLGDFERLFHRK